jgi:hypothetical protein
LLRLAVDVAGGKLAFGIADTDNPLEEIRGGQPTDLKTSASWRLAFVFEYEPCSYLESPQPTTEVPVTCPEHGSDLAP